MQTIFQISGTRLLVSVSGQFDAHEAVGKFTNILYYCRGNSLDQVLIDFRSMDSNIFSTAAILYAHNISRQYQKHVADGGLPLRIAYVAPTGIVIDEVGALGILRDAGLEVLYTLNLPDAVNWLEADSYQLN